MCLLLILIKTPNSIFTDEDSGVNKPQTLQQIEAFSQWLRIQPEIDHVSTITDTFKRLNKNMHADDPNYYSLPDDRELAAQYLLLYEMSLPYGLDLTNQLNMNKSATRIMTMVKNSGSKELTALESRAKKWFSTNAPDLTLTAASPGLMFAHIGETNMSSMLKGTLVALVLISCLLVFALKSFKIGVISLMPNLLPAGIGFGIWGIYSGEVNLGLSVVLSMTLGIIVDDTVHFLSKYRHARMSGSDAEQSVRYAFASVGRALWITTLVLATGFSILMLSPFALNSDMGMLTSIIIVVALAVDFLFLPPFLMAFDKQNIKQEFIRE
jgi:predicted RND superfamily exporter protein